MKNVVHMYKQNDGRRFSGLLISVSLYGAGTSRTNLGGCGLDQGFLNLKHLHVFLYNHNTFKMV